VAWGNRLSGHVSGLSEAEFLANPLVQDAVVRCLECVGEASHQAMGHNREDMPEHIEFAEAYWARNRFAHGYYDLDMKRVWITATVSAPKLVADVSELLLTLDE